MSDTAPHAAFRVRARAFFRQPAIRGEKSRESRPQRLDALRVGSDCFRKMTCFVDQRSNLPGVDEKAESLVVVILVSLAHVAHRRPSL